MANDESKSEPRGVVAPTAPSHAHEWTHDDVEPTLPPVSVSTCTCGAIRRSWQDDDGESREEIGYLS